MQSPHRATSRPIAASTPAETRIYAVGDIHGRADLLMETFARIDDDLRRRPVAYAVEVYLGDYIDRGPHSSTVIDALAVRMIRNGAICLRGNHEALMERFLRSEIDFEPWQQLGAAQTFASYGIELRKGDTSTALRRLLHIVLPPTHELFLQCLKDSYCCGDFFFAHAGVRPGVAIERQNANDLIWIRSEFLDSDHDHGKFIVHGHTPVPHPDIRHNRINIDTGAWKTGTLTCAAIEGTAILIL
ncbi:serine/threonine protein phosphatase [Bradyrhizobium lablabi]|uniref:metallophosphoesterase family protein n=1 Tax=Bradyrhizobium lablabi TaxID=722472 RepID=UPI001BA4F27B|nr:metallophosphoesterase family protein [Bradyrhizobium lablabi]MBR1119987.1 serine/threonine protein phosphatase [Bradyrhizobium lablabi]